MSEDKRIYDKENPHKDIGKQKFRVRKAYTAWVEYDVVADSKDEAIDAVIEHGGIEKIEWAERVIVKAASASKIHCYYTINATLL